MNHSFSSTDPVQSMLHVRQQDVGMLPHGPEDLAALLAGASLESARPEFLACLDQMLENAAPHLPDVEEHLDQLKDHFLESLRQRLAEAGINPDQRLVLGLDEDGAFRVVEPADDPALVALFANCPEFGAAFGHIAVQATLLRGIQDIGAAMGREPGLDGRTLGTILPGRYHVCLKGGLSHFYVPR